MDILFSNQFVVVTREADGQIIRMRRAAVPLARLDDITVVFREFARLIPMRERATLAFLNDVRDAPMRNDPAFEKVVKDEILPLIASFARRAVLVKSAVGKLQVGRTAREQGATETAVFDDERAALAFLAPPKRPPAR